jgi:peptidoglycan hydrolase-like protein with peptidoglycan-binding domain
MRYRMQVWLAAGWLIAAGAAQAADVALIFGNERYARHPEVAGAAAALDAADGFRQAGFQVFGAQNADAQQMASALDRFISAAPKADRVVVVLNGVVVTSGDDTWLLPIDAAADPTLGATARSGVAVSTLLPVLAQHPGRAVLAVGSDGRTGRAGPFLAFGAGLDDMPQGVTVFSGQADRISWFATTALTRQGINLTDAARRLTGVTGGGYLPASYVLLAGQQGPDVPVPLPDPDPQTETVFWDATRNADTAAGYDAYLRRYPNGPHAAEARRLAEEIRTEPNRAARLVEDAMQLNRNQRREIQRALTLLGHDTRGIDGILGSGSRAAITEWQTVNGFERTGYLTREQIAALSRQAAARAADLEREAAARKQEQERQDRAYWAATGEVGDAAGLRSYLDRYPDGTYAALARERLDAIEEANRAKAAAQERALWDEVRQRNSAESYGEYIRRYPNGSFVEEAQARIRALTQDTEAQAARARAEAAEEALQLNQATRLLIEQKLAELQLNPGRVDGTFDDDTRRALRRYQGARGLTPSGYMDEATVVRLLADSFGGGKFGR